MKPPASTQWVHESNVVIDEEVLYRERFTDPLAGVRPLRLTTFPFGNAHIYPEAPVCSPDGQRFIFARHHGSCGFCTYWIADLATLSIRQITDEPGATPPGFTPDGSAVYYAAENTIWNISPDSFERVPVHKLPDELRLATKTLSLSSCGTRLAAAWVGREEGGVFIVDLSAGQSRIIFSHRDARNAHVQYCRGPGHLVMVQVNDDSAYDDDGNMIRMTGDLGVSLHVINDDGSPVAVLPIGRSPLERVQGHQCWLGRDQAVISTTHRRDHIGAPWRQNRIVAATVGDESYRVVCEGEEEAFTHIHTTIDGRFWVSDCNRTGRIHVGSTRTGRHKRFFDSGATFGASQLTHPHPFFLADGKSIGWNSDVTGITQVFVACIPDGYLDDLDS